MHRVLAVRLANQHLAKPALPPAEVVAAMQAQDYGRIEVAPWRRLTRDETAAVERATERYAAFVGLPAELQVVARPEHRAQRRLSRS